MVKPLSMSHFQTDATENLEVIFATARPAEGTIQGIPVIRIAYNPPTPALAKAGAAPGTTGGVEPGLSRPWPSPCPSLFQQARPRRPIQGNSSARHQRPNTMLPQAFPKPISPPASPSKATLPLNITGQTLGPCAFKGVQACRLPGLKPFKCFKSFRRPFQSQSRSPQAHPRQLFR